MYLQQNSQQQKTYILKYNFHEQMGNNAYEGIPQEISDRAKKATQDQLNRAIQVANQIGLTNQQALKIASLNVWEIIEQLNKGSLTSLQLVLAVILRTGRIGRDLCLLTETNFDYAIETARKYDDIRKQSGLKNWTVRDPPFNTKQFLPPLFGIPMSVKDSFDMEGFISTVGLSNRCNTKYNESPIVTCFKNAGVIPFARTNMPQMGMAFQTMNQFWGYAMNPWNKDRSSGGSTGGEGGLISSRCSVLGMGSDIGGSIRIPAQFCGIFALKPYSKRIPASYHTRFSDAFSGLAFGIPLCLGPLAKSTLDLFYFMKIATSQSFYNLKNYDPYVKTIEFDEKTFLQYSEGKSKFRIGYFTSFKDIEPTEASRRAVQQVVDLLRKMGHQCVEINIPNQKQIIIEFFKQNLGTGAQTYRDILNGQKPSKEYNSLFQLAQLPAPFRGLARCFGSCLMPRMYNYYLKDSITPMNAFQYQKHLGRIDKYKQEWIKYWLNNNLDFVICPGFGSQAIPHGGSEKTSLAASYTFIWNVLDMSVGTIPVTIVQQNEQNYETAYNDMAANELKQIARSSVGLPVGVQVVGLPFDEQKVLGLMNVLQNQIRFYNKYPLPTIQ